MKKHLIVVAMIALILLVPVALAADTTSSSSTTSSTSSSSSSSSSSSTTDLSALVYVSGVDLDPTIFYPGEPGTVTVHVTNGATQTVTLGSPDLIDPSLNVYNENSYQTKTNVGPGQTVDYTFLVSVDPAVGKNTYFPFFTVNPSSGNAIHATFKLVTDSREIEASISSKPDAFTLSNPGNVNLTIINPRDGAVKNIIISAAGPGIDVSPNQRFVSSIDAGNSVELPFSVTPNQDHTTLTFNISYQAGDYAHPSSVVLPITLGEDKTAAVPIVNNVALTSMGSYYDITGDVTNAGISDAKGLVITCGSPAKGTGKYVEYAVGSLAADDSSSFELTFSCNDLSAVPLSLRWKDDLGNNYFTNTTLDLRSGTGSPTSLSTGGTSGTRTTGTGGGAYTQGGNSGGYATRGGGGGSMFGIGGGRGNGMSAFYPLIAGAIVLAAGIVLYIKRKPIKAKLAGMNLPILKKKNE